MRIGYMHARAERTGRQGLDELVSRSVLWLTTLVQKRVFQHMKETNDIQNTGGVNHAHACARAKMLAATNMRRLSICVRTSMHRKVWPTLRRGDHCLPALQPRM